MNDYLKVLENIKSCFDQLWSFKMRGEKTIEIITPYSTTSSKFVSLFLTNLDGKFVISDGGLLNAESYDSKVDYDNQCLLKILYHFENYYQIKTMVDKRGYKQYYKTTEKQILIPNIIYDMGQFISMCVSSATVQFEDQKEKEEKETLEEFINSQPYYGSCTTEFLEGIELGAKWQAERMYSYEDLAEAFEAGKKVGEDNACMAENYRREDFKEWFEKFKKK